MLQSKEDRKTNTDQQAIKVYMYIVDGDVLCCKLVTRDVSHLEMSVLKVFPKKSQSKMVTWDMSQSAMCPYFATTTDILVESPLR